MPSISIEFLKDIKSDYKNYPIFIETGTYNGDTIFEMEKYFDKLYTIELSHKYFTKTKNRYSGNKIHFINGDSVDVFNGLLSQIDKNAIFFLDGHWSSGDTAKGSKDCPLIEELNKINKLFKNSAIVIIDDARLFGTKINEDWSEIVETKLIDAIKDRIEFFYYLDSNISKNDRLIIHIREL